MSVEENPRLKKIMKYVKDHPNTTKAKVIRHMKGKSATITTHKIIQECIDNGIFRMTKDRNNTQIHHLIINDKNEFNLISGQLSQIAKIIESMEKPLKRSNVAETYLGDDYGPGYKRLFELKRWFEFNYIQIFSSMLQILLVRVEQKITSEENSRILCSTIIKLMQRLTKQFYKVEVDSYFVDKGMSGIKEVLDELNTTPPPIDPPIRDTILETDPMDSILKISEDFKKKFQIG